MGIHGTSSRVYFGHGGAVIWHSLLNRKNLKILSWNNDRVEAITDFSLVTFMEQIYEVEAISDFSLLTYTNTKIGNILSVGWVFFLQQEYFNILQVYSEKNIFPYPIFLFSRPKHNVFYSVYFKLPAYQLLFTKHTLNFFLLLFTTHGAGFKPWGRGTSCSAAPQYRT